MSVVRVRDLSVHYPQRAEPTLRNLSLELKRGECLLVIGPSGCGKTTLALALGGYFPESVFARVEGEVSVGPLAPLEEDVSRVAKTLGLVFQNPDNQVVRSRVYPDLAFGPENLGWPPGRIVKAADRALDEYGLSDHGSRPVQSLSAGLKERLSLAGHGVMNPEVLVLDEPTAYLDARSRRDLAERLADFKRNHTLILLEHNCTDFLEVADRLLVLDETGRRTYLGSPRRYFEELSARDRLSEAPVLPAALRIQQRYRSSSPTPSSTGPGGEGFEVEPPGGTSRGAACDSGSAGGLSLTMDQLEQSESIPSDPCGVLSGSPDPEPGPKLCTLEDLHFRYESGTPAVNGVSGTLRRGEILGWAGVNGSGKTTLARLLAGLRKPSRGRLLWEGRPYPVAPGYEGRVGYVFENPEYQFIHSSVREEIASGAEGTTETWLKRFDLASEADTHPFQLSHGQQRRLSIASAAAGEPDLLVLDEPLTGLDRTQIHNVRELLRDLSKRGTSLVVISHNLEFLLGCVHRIWMLEGGRLCFSGTTREWARHPEEIVEAGLWPPPSLEVVFRKARDEGDGSGDPLSSGRFRGDGSGHVDSRSRGLHGFDSGRDLEAPEPTAEDDFAGSGERTVSPESESIQTAADGTESSPSWLWRIHPLYKILGGLILMVPVLITGDPRATAVSALVLLGLALVGRIPPTDLASFLVPAFGFALSLGLITLLFYSPPSGVEAWYRFGPVFLGPSGASAAVAAFLRVVALVLISGIVSLSTTPDTLALGLAQHGPVNEKLAFTLLVGSRFLPEMKREYRSIRDARQLREGNLGWRSMLNDVFLTVAAALRRSEQVARAMESRCFGSRQHRSYLRTIPLGWKDVLFVGGCLLLVVLQFTVFLWGGWWSSTSIL